MEKIQGQKNNNNVFAFNGHLFTKLRTSKDGTGTIYRCRLYQQKCKALVKESGSTLVQVKQHNHDKDPREVLKLRFITRLKESVKSNSVLRDLYAAVAEQFEEVVKELVPFSKVRVSLQRIKKTCLRKKRRKSAEYAMRN